jgi:hypothetical protein
MRTLAFALMACSLTCGSVAAQPQPNRVIVSRGGTFSPNSVQFIQRADPPSSALAGKFRGGSRGHSSSNGRVFYSRYLLDDKNHVYFGYELLLEEQQPGAYLATFGKLNLSPLEMITQTAPRIPAIATEWTTQPVPVIPEPRVVHSGDVISIDLFVDAATGAKLIDDIRIQPPRMIGSSPMSSSRTAPTVSGTARDFSAADAELQLAQPRVTLNGTSQNSAARGASNVHGALVWFYLPDHGRYVLSLAPHPELDFQKAGEARGGVITFTLGNDSIKLECPNQIAGGNAPYNLYVLRDPEWEPTAQSQKGQFATGSVDPGELAALKRK